jgi:hypothetical protein
MPQPMIEPPILDETNIEPTTQDQPITNPLPTTYKRPRDNLINLIAPPKIKQVNKYKEKVVEKPLVVAFDLPSQEEKKAMVDKPALA